MAGTPAREAARKPTCTATLRAEPADEEAEQAEPGRTCTAMGPVAGLGMPTAFLFPIRRFTPLSALLILANNFFLEAMVWCVISQRVRCPSTVIQLQGPRRLLWVCCLVSLGLLC